MKEISQKKTKKEGREHQILIGLVELYLKTGKPVGSNTLRENGFEHLSSATIRNYFAELEKQGFLSQQHTSGGRMPTPAAYRLYATEKSDQMTSEPAIEERLLSLRGQETRHLNQFLHNACELLSEVTGYAAFLSSVRFEQDFILEIKLLPLDPHRLLCVLITDFGQIVTEVMPCEYKPSSFFIKRLENYFQRRLRGQKAEKTHMLSEEEEATAIKLYNELMVRYIVRYSNFNNADLFRTGFARLLAYPEFNDPVALASGLSLFENTSNAQMLLNDCASSNELRFWIASDLAPYGSAHTNCSVIAIPYRIHQITVGALGILGPCRMPYHSLFGTLHTFSEFISEALTKSLYKFKLTFRHPRSGVPYLEREEQGQKLLELKSGVTHARSKHHA